MQTKDVVMPDEYVPMDAAEEQLTGGDTTITRTLLRVQSSGKGASIAYYSGKIVNEGFFTAKTTEFTEQVLTLDNFPEYNRTYIDCSTPKTTLSSNGKATICWGVVALADVALITAA